MMPAIVSRTARVSIGGASAGLVMIVLGPV
jgi:hypothetical protein